MKNKTVGIVYSMSDKQVALANLISQWGYKVVFITPRQELKVDLLLLYTDLDFNPQRIGQEVLPAYSRIDTWLDQFMWTDSLDFYVENQIPIIGIDKGVFYLRSLLKAIPIHNNPFKTKGYSIHAINSSRFHAEGNISGYNLSLIVNPENAVNLDTGNCCLSYVHNTRTILGIQLPLDRVYGLLKHNLHIILHGNTDESPPEKEGVRPTNPPPTGVPPRARKQDIKS